MRPPVSWPPWNATPDGMDAWRQKVAAHFAAQRERAIRRAAWLFVGAMAIGYAVTFALAR